MAYILKNEQITSKQLALRVLGILLYSLIFFVVGSYSGAHDRLVQDQAVIDQTKRDLAQSVAADTTGAAQSDVAMTDRDLASLLRVNGLLDTNSVPGNVIYLSLAKNNDAAAIALPQGKGVAVYLTVAGNPKLVFLYGATNSVLSAPIPADDKSFTVSSSQAGQPVSKTFHWNGTGFLDQAIPVTSSP